MRILWCTHSLAGFEPEGNGYNGCGWITSLLKEIKKKPEIEIGVAFYYGKSLKPIRQDGTIFYPMWDGHIGFFDKIKSFCGSNLGWRKKETIHLMELTQVVKDFCPDVIHVWGTETEMGLIVKYTSVPVVVHIQGLMHPYNNMLCPPGFSKWDYICKDGLSLVKIIANFNSLLYWKYKAERETRIFSICKNYFGRTDWDRSISRLMSSDSHYYYCSEMLRDDFYTNEKWEIHKHDKFRIVSTISPPLYKGMDMILKTAELLAEFGAIDFEWYVIGQKESRNIEKKIGVRAKDVHVCLLGVKNADELKMIELSSDLYFHPSYIDNSPNSVCEAQILGLPVMATNVGGQSSLIQNRVTGLLVPSNEPHMAAALITMIVKGEIDVNMISENEKKMAEMRHNKDEIITSLITGYKKIIHRCGQ